jgi:hypothetical protein
MILCLLNLRSLLVAITCVAWKPSAPVQDANRDDELIRMLLKMIGDCYREVISTHPRYRLIFTLYDERCCDVHGALRSWFLRSETIIPHLSIDVN